MMTKSIVKILLVLLVLMAMATLPWLLMYVQVWFSKPDLATEPPRHVALTATIEIEGRSYPVELTWSEENDVAWNAGYGWHTRWKSSHQTFVRILDARFAVVIWLPSVAETDLGQFRPDIALIDQSDLQSFRLYGDLSTGEKRDGVFELTQLKIERSSAVPAMKPMTKDEESLKADIAARRYGYLYGMLFHKEQWNRSPKLEQLMSGLKDVTPLGKSTKGKEKNSDVWQAFYTFNSGIAMAEKMDRHLFGFEFRDESWTPLPFSGVHWYREGLNEASDPIWVLYQGHRIDQQQHELLFDGPRQQLVVIWRYSLGPLERR